MQGFSIWSLNSLEISQVAASTLGAELGAAICAAAAPAIYQMVKEGIDDEYPRLNYFIRQPIEQFIAIGMLVAITHSCSNLGSRLDCSFHCSAAAEAACC